MDAIIKFVDLQDNDAVRQSYGSVKDAYLGLELVGLGIEDEGQPVACELPSFTENAGAFC